MFTLQELIELKTDFFKGKKVKLVRHKDSRTEYKDILKDREALLEYQKEQGREVFKNTDYLISFIGASLLIFLSTPGAYIKIKDGKVGMIF